MVLLVLLVGLVLDLEGEDEPAPLDEVEEPQPVAVAAAEVGRALGVVMGAGRLPGLALTGRGGAIRVDGAHRKKGHTSGQPTRQKRPRVSF